MSHELEIVLLQEMEKLFEEENQEALDKWLAEWFNNPRSPREIEDLGISMAHICLRLNTMFSYKNLIRLGYKPFSDSLKRAVKSGDTEIVQFLLPYSDPNKGQLYSRPLIVAIGNHDHTMIDILLQAGATPHEEDGMEAAYRGDITLLHKLYIHGLLPTAQMIQDAIDEDNIEMVDAILSIHPKLEFSFDDIRSKEMAMYFLKTVPSREEALAMVEKHDPRAVMLVLVMPELAPIMFDYALEQNNYEALKAILADRSLNRSPFVDKMPTIAARMDVMQFVIWNRYSDTKLEGYDYPMIEAIAAGNIDILRVFLEALSPTNIISLRGMTPVMLAAALNNVEILDLLLRRNAFIGPVDDHSPLSVAVAYNSVECARMLYANVVCDGDDCVETIHGRKIPINLKDATPEMKALFI